MQNIKVAFGKQIKKLRLERNLSQETLAYESGVDRTYLPGIEKGERNVSLLVIAKLAKGLKVEVKELFELI